MAFSCRLFCLASTFINVRDNISLVIHFYTGIIQILISSSLIVCVFLLQTLPLTLCKTSASWILGKKPALIERVRNRDKWRVSVFTARCTVLPKICYCREQTCIEFGLRLHVDENRQPAVPVDWLRGCKTAKIWTTAKVWKLTCNKDVGKTFLCCRKIPQASAKPIIG